MTFPQGLSPHVVGQVTSVLARFPAVESAVVFGSRAKGTAKLGSDIDLALTGGSLDWRLIGEIYDALDDLLLPYTFSLIPLDAATAREVAADIARVGIPIFERARAVRDLAPH